MTDNEFGQYDDPLTSSKILQFCTGQMNKSELAWGPGIITRVSDGLYIAKITNLAVCTCKFEKLISSTYSTTGLNVFFLRFHDLTTLVTQLKFDKIMFILSWS